MKIIVRESLDDFNDDYLDYDEDKYYLVDTFKDFKKYGHKDKHHQNIQAITSNYKELLKNLEDHNIYIKDDFKDIKESDLKKETDYFILPNTFINNVVEQLGYKPNTMRTYKDDIVLILDKEMTATEFENMISDRKNEFHWITECRFKDAGIQIFTNPMSKIRITIWGATFTKGDIYKATLANCKLINTNTIDSMLIKCEFRNGKCVDSIFKHGVWFSGDWSYYDSNKNSFYNSEWHNGTWNGGTFFSSTWHKGIWEHGSFDDSTWLYGTWKKGTFMLNSTWEDGIWEDGTFINSTWNKGIWEKGNFTASTWFNGTWNNGTFDSSEFYKGDWENGFFINSTWHDDANWKDGTWVIGYKNKYEGQGDNVSLNNNIYFAFKKDLEKKYKLSKILKSKLILKQIKKYMTEVAFIKHIFLGSYKLTIEDIDKKLSEL